MQKDIARILTAVIMLLSGMKGWGLDIAVAPGELESKTAGLDVAGKDIRITGEGDARDFGRLRELSREAASMDLSGMELRSCRLEGRGYEGKNYYRAGEMPPYLFFGSKVKKVKLPANLEEIADGMFASSAVEEVEIGESVRRIGRYAFYGAGALENVTGMRSVEAIGEGGFGGCHRLKELPATAGIKTVGREAFKGSGIEVMRLDNIMEAAPFSLSGMGNLREVSLNEKGGYGEGVLMDCPALEKIEGMPGELPGMFAALSGPLNVAGAGKTERFGSYSLACSRIKNITLGDNLREMGDGVFYGCNDLESIDARAIEEGVPATTERSFEGIEPGEIELRVTTAMYPSWAADKEWSRFRIKIDDSGISHPVAGSGVSINYRRGIITVETEKSTVGVEIYSLKGEKLYSGECRDRLEKDTREWGEKVIIVRAGRSTKVLAI